MRVESSEGTSTISGMASRDGSSLSTREGQGSTQDEIVLVMISKCVNTFLSRESIASFEVKA